MVLGSGRRSRTRCGEGHEINSELLIPICVCVCGWAHQRWSVFHTLKLSSITMISFPFSKDQSMLLHYWCILGWGSLRVQAGLLFRNSCYFTTRMPHWNTFCGYMHTHTQHYSMADWLYIFCKKAYQSRFFSSFDTLSGNIEKLKSGNTIISCWKIYKVVSITLTKI